jgi:tryptophan-rich sensory protein
MAYSAWRVWRAPSSPARTRALALWATQLGLNAAWSPTFFRAKQPRAAMLVVSSLLPVLGAYVRVAWQVDKLAATALVPYLGWTGFATFLNREIVRKNRFRFWK